jgi:hypothetical protein
MRAPTLTGRGGRAWNIELNPLTTITQLAQTASLRAWLLNVPGAHPFWSYWSLGCVHLRDIPCVKPAFKKYPSAEFEIFIYAIDPTKCPQPDPDRPQDGYPPLFPLDLQYQFHGVSDEAAWLIADLCVTTIMEGRLSPDQDYRSAWISVLDQTVQHFREGRHAL